MLEGLNKNLYEKGKSCKSFLLLLFLELKIDSKAKIVLELALSETFGRAQNIHVSQMKTA